MSLSDYIALLALGISIIALVNSLYSNSDWQAYRRGSRIVELSFHEICPEGKRKFVFFDKADDPVSFHHYSTHIAVRNKDTGLTKIVKIDQIDTIEYMTSEE